MNFITNRSISKTNLIMVEDALFLNNTARYGGGLILTSSFSDVQFLPGKKIYSQNCTWESNIGKAVSPAVDIAPYVHSNTERHGYLPVPQFQDIQIYNNVAKDIKNEGLIKSHHKNSGVFLIWFCSTNCYIERRLHIPYNPASARLNIGLLMFNALIQLKIIQY